MSGARAAGASVRVAPLAYATLLGGKLCARARRQREASSFSGRIVRSSGPDRTAFPTIPQRSAALARDLNAYNVELAKIANKYKDKLPKVGW